MLFHLVALNSWVKYFALFLLVTPLALFSAPGDVELKILTRTGSFSVGPDENPISKFEFAPSGDAVPVAIDESGFVSFAAEVEVGGQLEYGLYQATAPGTIKTFIQTDQPAPGLTTEDLSEPSGRRELQLHTIPRRGFAMSKDGNAHAIPFFTRYDGPFLYSGILGEFNGLPITWPHNVSEKRNVWDQVQITDGRGETQERSGGGGGTQSEMLISNSGIVYWNEGDGIFRSSPDGGIHAVMFTDTPAPGFEESESAILGTPMGFRGIDDAGNAFFHCRVTMTSGFKNAVYRQNMADNSLTLLFVDGVTELPDGSEAGKVTGGVQAEDVFAIGDGTVFLRVRAGNTRGGFWKIAPDGTISLLGLFYSNGFASAQTDQGEVDFRNIHLADWAVSENGTVFFSADVRNGETSSAQEGVWKIDPEDFSIQTIARAPWDFIVQDEPEIVLTFDEFTNLTAAGGDRLAFVAETEAGIQGLFATDKNGGAVKIVYEGEEIGGDPVIDFHFTPDHAGEDLSLNKGSPGLNSYGELAFLATMGVGISDEYTSLVKASYEGEVRPTGFTYVWDEGISSISWHDVDNGKTNWVDATGVRWNLPPTQPPAKVIIPEGFHVEMHQGINEIASLDSAGYLDLHASLVVTGLTKLENEIVIKAGGSLLSTGDVIVDGEIFSAEDGIRTISTDPLHSITTSGSLTGGNAGIWSTASNGVVITNEAEVSGIKSAAIFVESESGTIQIKNQGDLVSDMSAGILAKATTGDIAIFSPEDGPGNGPVQIGSITGGIDAATAGAIDIHFYGDINTISSADVGGVDNLSATSSGGSVSINSKGSLSGISSIPGGAGGIHAVGVEDTTAKHEGSINVNGIGIYAASINGDSIIDARETFLSIDQAAGLVAHAVNGDATIFFDGELSSSGGGLFAEAGGNIVIESNGPIHTIGGVSSVSSAQGILARSTDGSITITHSGEISTTLGRGAFSPGIEATALSDISINSMSSFSTLNGTGIFLESSNGNVELNHEGPIAATDFGGGIFAKASSGWISVLSEDPASSVGSNGSDVEGAGHGISLEAQESVNLHWAGDILSFGNFTNGINAVSETAGVSVTTKGDILSAGNTGYGVALSGSSQLTLNVLSGSISGSDSPEFSAGVFMVDGTENKVNNYGSISSLNSVAIKAGDGNETIDNNAQISGSIDLGSGTNVIENRSAALLVTHEDLKLGMGNSFNNSGHLQIGELGEAALTTTMEGNLVMEASSSYRMEIQDTTIEGDLITDKLLIQGDALIDGELIVSLQEDYTEQEAGDTFTILTADALSGTFFSVRVLNSSHRFAEISRKVGLDVTYTETTVTGSIVLLDIDDYDSWKELVFNEVQQADELVSGPDANPDGDGMSNGDESLFGGDPLAPDGSPVSFNLGDTDAPAGIQISATFTVADGIADRDWVFETSSDLGDWTSATVSEISREDMGDFSKLTVSFDQPISNDGSTFVRLKSEAVNP